MGVPLLNLYASLAITAQLLHLIRVTRWANPSASIVFWAAHLCLDLVETGIDVLWVPGDQKPSGGEARIYGLVAPGYTEWATVVHGARDPLVGCFCGFPHQLGYGIVSDAK